MTAQIAEARKALVLYGSETGNAQDIAEELGRICERLRFATSVCELDSIDIRHLPRYKIVLFVVSTTGQGELPINSRKFWKVIRSARLPPGCLKTVRFSSFGLGDSSYPKFNWAHRKLYNRLVQLGAHAICNRGESDEQFPDGIDGTFVPWSVELRKRLLEEYPLPDSVEPIPDYIPIEPKWTLDFVDTDAASRETSALLPRNGAGTGIQDLPTTDLITIPNSLTATIVANTRITAASHFQDTRHIILTIPGKHDYPPGATATIYPKNFPSDVSDFLSLMHWNDIADNPIQFVASTPEAARESRPPLAPSILLTLRSLLTSHLDIMAIPRRSFFGQLQQYTTDEMHLERLQEFTSPELIDELYDYTTRPRRSILEAISDFPSVRLPWQKICSVIPMMRGRQFSIAKPVNTPAEPTETRIDLLIAIVRYRTIIKRIRNGVATRYIATLQPGTQISITLQDGGLGIKRDGNRLPVVMVAPGTGVAPMRALAWERYLHTSSAINVQDLLFFGCRNKSLDEYFGHEWSNLGVEMLGAYSRDQREKVYVQDMIRQQSARVFSLLAERGGIVFVCGSSGRMPQAVRQALTDVFVKEGAMVIEDAEEFLKRLEKEGRYLQETW
ncbi:sulfite reductase flavo protein alpha-component [Microthyrium microscopicum]|uniref:NADPH-dependent diflavin oxidoreductase 1 n=1 Tax=Microthyrium microscopicum TaxID=703497 RepID=A0A6A6UV01_9PEZI|nr:sulfite reductase flavo protein alpha-component [Microthyrium microscopicum]